MHNPHPVIRAIDVGYGNTKFVKDLAADGTPQFMMFPSFAPVSVSRGLNGGSMSRRDTVPIPINDVTYEVGPDVRLLVDDQTVHPRHDRYIDTNDYLALNLGALHYIDVPQIDLLVVGLPMSLLSSRSKDLAARLKGIHELGNGRQVWVRDVLVLAQPIGGYVAHAESVGKDAMADNKNRVIIDPGYVTLDWLVANGVKAIEARSGAFHGSMRQVLQAIADGLTEDREINSTGERYNNLQRIDEGLRSGVFRFNGREISLSRYLPRSLAHVNKAIGAMKNSIGTASDIDEVILVGGGAGFFRPVMDHLFPEHPVTVASGALYANVRGFQIVGEKIYDKRRNAA